MGHREEAALREGLVIVGWPELDDLTPCRTRDELRERLLGPARDAFAALPRGATERSGLTTFPPDGLAERVELLGSATAHLPNLEVATFDGLLVDFCRERDVGIVVRGLRAVSDFESELEMAQMNHRLAGVETFFVATSPVHSFLSSTLVKEVARFDGDVAPFVPPAVNDSLRAHFDGKEHD